jgi:hypothetical protein
MLDRAWALLVDEVAVVRSVDRQLAEGLLVKALTKSNLKVLLPS